MTTLLSSEENGVIAGFLRWWGRELFSLAPRRAPNWSRRPLFLRIKNAEGGEAATLFRRRWGKETALRSVALVGGQPGRDTTFLRDVPAAGPALRLTRDQVLSRRVKPPRAAESRLEQVLRHDMASQLPFGPEEAYFDYRILGRSRDSLDVEMFCIPRSRLDRWRAALAEEGLAPVAVTIEGEESTPAVDGRAIDLLRELKERRWTAGAPRRMWLGALAAVLAIIAIWLPYQEGRSRNAELQQEADALRRRAQTAITLEEEIAAFRNRDVRLSALLDQGGSRLAILAAATRALPDGAFVRRLEIEGSKLRIDGEAAEAAPLIAAIEASEAFRGAVFLSPVIRSQKGGERFQIGAEIIAGAEEAK